MPENQMSALTKAIVDSIIQGYSLEESAERAGVSTEDGVRVWRRYVSEREETSQAEQWLIHLMRLENLLVKCNKRLENATEADDFEVVLKLLDRIEALQDTNLSRKRDAENAVQALTNQQAQLMVGAFMAFGAEMQKVIEQALTKPTIKAIRGELLDSYDVKIQAITERALGVLEGEEVAG